MLAALFNLFRSPSEPELTVEERIAQLNEDIDRHLSVFHEAADALNITQMDALDERDQLLDEVTRIEQSIRSLEQSIALLNIKAEDALRVAVNARQKRDAVRAFVA